MKVVVSEFMDENALKKFGDDVDIAYEPGLVDDRAGLLASVSAADALIVRNRTQVNAEVPTTLRR